MLSGPNKSMSLQIHTAAMVFAPLSQPLALLSLCYIDTKEKEKGEKVQLKLQGLLGKCQGG